MQRVSHSCKVQAVLPSPFWLSLPCGNPEIRAASVHGKLTQRYWAGVVVVVVVAATML